MLEAKKRLREDNMAYSTTQNVQIKDAAPLDLLNWSNNHKSSPEMFS